MIRRKRKILSSIKKNIYKIKKKKSNQKHALTTYNSA